MTYHPLSRWIGAATVLIALLVAGIMHAHAAAPVAPFTAASQQAPNVGNPGQLVLSKRVQTTSQPVKPGDIVTYTIDLTHEGGIGPVETVISDVLPLGLHLAGPVAIREVTPNVGPLFVFFRERGVSWRGHLSVGGQLELTFPARIGFCVPTEMVAGTATRHNVVTGRQTDGSIMSAAADVTVNCVDPLANVSVTQTITPTDTSNPDAPTDMVDAAATDLSPNADVIDVFPGETLHQHIQVTNNGIIAVLIGLVTHQKIETVQNGSGQGFFGTPEYFQLAVQPGETKRIDRDFTLDEDLKPETVIVQQLGYCAPDENTPACPDPQDDKTGFLHFAKPIRMAIRLRDLGDAPDSTNHFTKTMEAYSGIKALFPTVFDPTTGTEQGPMHIFPRPFHLGQFVSQEVDADRGRDRDGIHNILPRLDQANLDRFDDGLRPRDLAFSDCQTTTIPVQIFVGPDAANLLAQYQHKGYLNIWLDSNRDGDWADAVPCPGPVSNVSSQALEHIVIDYPVDVTLLGPGIHVVNVPTNLVSWPAKFSDKRAWLRVTLSERVNKPLTAGGIAYGDGRGYDQPFAFGETEDYVVNARDLVNGADMVVHKEGVVNQDFESEPGFDVGETVWLIRYRNQGLDTAHTVMITDTLPAEISVDDSSLHVRTIPDVPFTRNGNTLLFKRGDVEAGQGGAILVRVHFHKAVAELQTITNTAIIGSNNDGDASNNQASSSVKLGLRTPLITYPGNGTTCNTTFDARGRAIPGSEVDLYIDNTLAATLTADATDGHWVHSVTLTPGTHTFFALTRKNGVSSLPSETISVIIDPALAYDPLSVRFVDDNGNVRRPVDKTGRTDAEGWGVYLRANTNYTVTLHICCSDPANATVSLDVPGVGTVNLTYKAGRDLFVGTFKTGAVAQTPTAQPISITVICNGEQSTFNGQVLIDPEGTVYDLSTRQPLSGASVACLQADSSAVSNQVFTLWPAADYGQVNPQSTPADGHFSFLTPAGVYQLTVNHAGYQPYTSPTIDVGDQPVHYDVLLTPAIVEASTQIVEVSTDGFSPAIITVKPGAVIEWVNMDTNSHTVTSEDLVQGAASGATVTSWDSGLLNAGDSYKFHLNTEGAFTYVDRTNPANTATIIVSKDAGNNPGAGQNFSYLPVVHR